LDSICPVKTERIGKLAIFSLQVPSKACARWKIEIFLFWAGCVPKWENKRRLTDEGARKGQNSRNKQQDLPSGISSRPLSAMIAVRDAKDHRRWAAV
jgi:hypothetical protein